MRNSVERRKRKISAKITEKDRAIALYEAIIYQLCVHNNGEFKVKLDPKDRFKLLIKGELDADNNTILTVKASTESDA